MQQFTTIINSFCDRFSIPRGPLHRWPTDIARIQNILDEIKISGSAKELYDMMIKKIFTDNSIARKRPPDKIEDEIRQLNSRIIKLQDSFIDSQIDIDFLKIASNGIKMKVTL